MMTPNQIELVQTSFKKVESISDVAAKLFYGRLFEIAPHVKPLFKSDLKEQGRKLMATLGLVVSGLAEPEKSSPQPRLWPLDMWPMAWSPMTSNRSSRL